MDSKMFLGLDAGSATVKGVVLNQQAELQASSIRNVTGDYQADITAIMDALDTAGYAACVATGYAQDLVRCRAHTRTEISCHARGIFELFPEAELLIDIGGQDLKAIRIGADGRPQAFQMNDKCAAGTGRFLDVMARALAIDVSALSQLALQATQPARISSMCAVFAESEVITLLSRGCPKADVGAGLFESVAERVYALAVRLGRGGPVALSGGVVQSPALVLAIERRLKCTALLPPQPQLVGAYGAALLALEGEG